MENKCEYVKPMVEIIEFSNEEVVMNIVASSLVPEHEMEIDVEDDEDLVGQ